MAAPPPRTIRSASETCLPPFCAPLKSLRIFSSALITLAVRAGSFAAQSFCGARRMRAPLAPPRLSLLRKVDADAQAVATSCPTLSPEARICFLSAAISRALTGL